MSSLALLAMILGLIGLYGVVTYSVSQRTREIGIRMALGAQRKAILELFLKEFIWLIVIGLGLGLACTFGVSTYVRSFLFGITVYDTSTIVLVVAIVTMATLIATFIPAKRAALVNPVEALRAE
jgi:macrolide transport system ATP-binding/permease protein